MKRRKSSGLASLRQSFASLMPDLPFVSPDQIHVGGWNLPSDCALSHCVIWGAPRMGKSTLAKLYALSALNGIKHGYGERAFFTDPKGEWMSLLHRYIGSDAIRYVQPSDRRSARWDAFAELHSPEDAERMGADFTEPAQHGDSRGKFFETAGDDIHGALMGAEYVVHGTHGSLRNVVASTKNKDCMRAHIKRAGSRYDWVLSNYFDFRSPNRDVVSSVSQTMNPLRAAVEDWERATTTYTIEGFLNGLYALVLGFSQEYPQAFAGLARATIGRISRKTMAEPDCGKPKTYAFLDEIGFWGDLSSILPGWLALGPAKGCCATITCQDFGLLRRHYGPDLTSAILGMCAQQFYFRLADVDSAEHASRAFGDSEHLRISQSINYSRSETGAVNIAVTDGEHLERVRSVPPDVFLGLDMTQRGLPQLLPLAPPLVDEVRFYASSPWLGTYTDSIHLDTIRRWLPPVAIEEA